MNNSLHNFAHVFIIPKGGKIHFFRDLYSTRNPKYAEQKKIKFHCHITLILQ